MYEALRNKWEQLSLMARTGLVSGVIFILAALLLGSLWIFKDDYQVLFADLNAQDASSMVAELERLKTPYRLAEGGTAILVEREAVYKTRLKLMGKGLDLHGAVGFEIFNNADFGMTEFAQKVNFQRALQGELARTIMGFDEVKSARVHLVLPDAGLFKRQAAKPKASISLIMKGDSRLQAEQISGIQRLVAASVPEIDASAVTIVDQHGIAVSKPASDDVLSGIAGRLDTKRQIEDYLTRKLIAVMDRAVGPGRAIVSIDVSLNYDQVKVTQEDVLPLPNTAGQNVGAITRRRDSAQGGDPISELLTAGNAGSRGVQSAGPVSSSSEVEFINGRRVEQVVSQPGGIRRLSVGIMVPDVADPVELAKLKEVVTMAAGINPARGDAIVVYNHTPSGNRDDPQEAHNQADAIRGESGKAQPHGVDELEFVNILSPQQWSLAAGSTLVLAIAFGAWQQRRRRHTLMTQPRLSQEQRERLLLEVTRWAAGEKA